MAIASIDEAIRNAIAVGADYDRIAILDNFCWPSVDDELTMGTLVRACEACRDAALAFGIPFISGKDSLHNQFTDKETGKVIRIPNTLLISAIGIVPDVKRCVTMDLKLGGAPVYLISAENPADLKSLAGTHRAMAKLIADGHVASVHDVSDGGLAVAAAEMCIASGRGLNLNPEFLAGIDPFAERPGQYILEMAASAFDAIAQVHLREPKIDGHAIHTSASEHDSCLAILRKHFAPTATATFLGMAQSHPALLIMNHS